MSTLTFFSTFTVPPPYGQVSVERSAGLVSVRVRASVTGGLLPRIPVDAAAVVFSLERQRDPGHPFHRADFQSWQRQYRNI